MSLSSLLANVVGQVAAQEMSDRMTKALGLIPTDGGWKWDGFDDEAMDEVEQIAEHRLLDDVRLSGVTTSGKQIDIKDYHGKFVLIDFWGTWCGYCLEEIPNLKLIHNALQKHGFEVVGVAADSTKALNRFNRKQTLPWENIVDEDMEIADRLGISGFPTTFLIDPEGNHVAKNVFGPELLDELVVRMDLKAENFAGLRRRLKSDDAVEVASDGHEMSVEKEVAGANDSTTAAEHFSSETSGASATILAPTHRHVRWVFPTFEGKKQPLHTLTTTADGRILACVGRGQNGMVLMMNAEGETLQVWKPGIVPTAITLAPDGTVFVGGEGRVVRLSSNGKVESETSSPHFDGDVDSLKATIKEKLLKDLAESRIESAERETRLTNRIHAIEGKAEADRSRSEVASLGALKKKLKLLKEDVEWEEEYSQKELSDNAINRAAKDATGVVSLAASETDLFICAENTESGGYGVWRVGLDLQSDENKFVLTGLWGCCGQMDIQCSSDGNLVVSENTEYNVATYDRDGVELSRFGKKDRTCRDGFGSCCNPMNSMPLPDGSLLTAESSIGHIKHFSAAGELLAYVGKAEVTPGCKHCAMGYDEQNDLYFMMYADENAICVLARADSQMVADAQVAIQKRQGEFLSKAAGKWLVVEKKKKKKKGKGKKHGGNIDGADSTEKKSANVPTSKPIQSLRMSSDGTIEILDGERRGQMGKVALIPSSGKWSEIPLAITLADEAFDNTWEFGKTENVAKLTFFQLDLSLKLKRIKQADVESTVKEQVQ